MLTLCQGEKIGDYTVREFLARGGFALAYLAVDKKGESVVLKIGDLAGGGRYMNHFPDVTNERRPEGISPDETPAEAIFFRKEGARVDFLDAYEIDAMIRAEGELLKSIQRRHVVGVRDLFQHNGRWVTVMDYVRGKTLREKIRALDSIRLNWFLTIVRVLQSLAKGKKPFYHGDLKPENIIVKHSGEVVLIDPAMRQGELNVITTTPHYNPMLLCDSKADVMGIGVMLYEILTDVLPFDEVPWEYAGREQGGEVERLSLNFFLSYQPPRDLNPNTPEPLDRIIRRCLAVPDYGLPQLEADLVQFLRRD